MWVCSVVFWLNALRHTSHTKAFSPVWMRTCRSSCDCFMNAFPHVGHRFAPEGGGCFGTDALALGVDTARKIEFRFVETDAKLTDASVPLFVLTSDVRQRG